MTLMNHLIAALPADEFIRLQSYLQPVSLELGEVIYESGEQLEYILFPTTAIISLLYIMENGSTAEIGMARQRRPGRDRVVYGRHYHAEPGGRPERGQCLPNLVQGTCNRCIWPRRCVSENTAALYAGTDDADLANRRLQPPALRRTAALPLAADQPRPSCNPTS